jgi:hypothetical protein
VSANFLIKIKKGEIRTANPTLSTNAKRFDLSDISKVFKVDDIFTI